jgi:hypothetical protein
MPLLGTAFSYDDYDIFFDQELAPVKVTNEQLLNQPEIIIEEPDDDDIPQQEQQQEGDDDLFPMEGTPQNMETIDFDDDFYY